MPEKEFKCLLVKVTNEFKEDTSNMEILQNSLQHLHGGSQTPVSENSMSSLGFCRHEACMWVHIHSCKYSHIQIDKKSIFKN